MWGLILDLASFYVGIKVSHVGCDDVPLLGDTKRLLEGNQTTLQCHQNHEALNEQESVT